MPNEHVLIIASDPEHRSEYGRLLGDAGYRRSVCTKFDPDHVVQEIVEKKPDLVIADCGGSTMGLVKRIRKDASAQLVYVVILENQGTMFLGHLSTPRLQYLTTRSRFTKLLDAIRYGFAGKSTMQRMSEMQEAD